MMVDLCTMHHPPQHTPTPPSAPLLQELIAQHTAASKRLLKYLPAHEGALRETRSFIERALHSDEAVQTNFPFSRKNSSIQELSRMSIIDEKEGDDGKERGVGAPRIAQPQVNADGSRSVGC